MDHGLSPITLDIAGPGVDLSTWANGFFAYLFAFPFVTCFLWSLSGLVYMLMRSLARRRGIPDHEPSYSVVIPFHAEPEAALATVHSLQGVSPAPLEIVIVDDGSPKPIPPETELPPGTRIVRMPHNMGKAGALQGVLGDLRGEILVCMDADTKTESMDWRPMLASFADPHLGAVTGKIRPAEEKGLVEAFQALDYLTVIMLIKAAESVWGGLMTVSGAFTAFRAEALHSVGGWSSASSTEDIDVSWRLQAAGWRLAFETDWVSRVEMAPNFKALWRQRRRWSMGLGRALRDHGMSSLVGGARHLPIVVMTLASLIWIVSILGLASLTLVSSLGLDAVKADIDFAILPAILAAALVACYAQFACAVVVDGNGVKPHWRSALIAPLYPVYFWGLLITSFLGGFPKGWLRRDKGTWRRTARRVEKSE